MTESNMAKEISCLGRLIQENKMLRKKSHEIIAELLDTMTEHCQLVQTSSDLLNPKIIPLPFVKVIPKNPIRQNSEPPNQSRYHFRNESEIKPQSENEN